MVIGPRSGKALAAAPYVLGLAVFVLSGQETATVKLETQLLAPVSNSVFSANNKPVAIRAALIPEAPGDVAKSEATGSIQLASLSISAPVQNPSPSAIADEPEAQKPRLLDEGVIFPQVNTARKGDLLVKRTRTWLATRAQGQPETGIAMPNAATKVDREGVPLVDKSVDKVQSLAFRQLDNPKDALQCLAKAIYFEARGEPVNGQVAVAQVVMNRVKHWFYPNDICGVVFQNQHWRNKCQFSFACDGRPDRPRSRVAWAKAVKLANNVMNGALYLKRVGGATHYHANYVRPRWIRDMRKVERIGRHIFYRVRAWS